MKRDEFKELCLDTIRELETLGVICEDHSDLFTDSIGQVFDELGCTYNEALYYVMGLAYGEAYEVYTICRAILRALKVRQVSN